MSSTGRTSFAEARSVPGVPETVVGPDTRCVGTLRSEGCVCIDGVVEGTLAVADTVIIGESGRVNATITAQNGHVAGAVTGTITIVEQLELAPTGTIRGHITGTIKVIQLPGPIPASRMWDRIHMAACSVEQSSAHIVAALQGMRKDGNQLGYRRKNPPLVQANRQGLLERWRLWREEERSDYSHSWRRSFAMGTVTVLVSVLLGIAIVVLLNLVQR